MSNYLEGRRHLRAMRGFTLLELLVVVAILGLLVGYVAPRYLGQLSNAEVRTAQAQLDAASKALEQFRLDVGRYPSEAEGLAALQQAPAGTQGWQGPYLKKALPPDPWGHAYLYSSDTGYRVATLGKDGKPGGNGADADLEVRGE